MSRVATDAAFADAVEAAAEEEEDPGGEGEPDTVSHGGGATIDGVDAGFGEEEEGDVKDECEECDHGCEAGDAGTAACHGKFTDVGEKAKDGRSGCEDECHDMKHEGVGDPFDYDLGDLDGGIVADECVDV